MIFLNLLIRCNKLIFLKISYLFLPAVLNFNRTKFGHILHTCSSPFNFILLFIIITIFYLFISSSQCSICPFLSSLNLFGNLVWCFHPFYDFLISKFFKINEIVYWKAIKKLEMTINSSLKRLIDWNLLYFIFTTNNLN